MSMSEERDALVRSRKKVRAGDGLFTNGQNLTPRVEDSMEEEKTGEGGDGKKTED